MSKRSKERAETKDALVDWLQENVRDADVSPANKAKLNEIACAMFDWNYDADLFPLLREHFPDVVDGASNVTHVMLEIAWNGARKLVADVEEGETIGDKLRIKAARGDTEAQALLDSVERRRT